MAHGAEVNARSSDLRTPLMVAARCPGNSATVKFLLDRGANPNPNAHPVAESSPLIEDRFGHGNRDRPESPPIHPLAASVKRDDSVLAVARRALAQPNGFG